MKDNFFSEIYETYFKQIYNYIFRSTLNKELTEDLTANAFYKAYKFLQKNNTKIENLSAWLYKIATNELLLHYRRKKIINIINLTSENYDYTNDIVDNNNKTIDHFVDFLTVKEVLKELKPKEKIIIEMFYFENKSYEEMSLILGIKINNLRVKIHRILKKIAKIIES